MSFLCKYLLLSSKAFGPERADDATGQFFPTRDGAAYTVSDFYKFKKKQQPFIPS